MRVRGTLAALVLVVLLVAPALPITPAPSAGALDTSLSGLVLTNLTPLPSYSVTLVQTGGNGMTTLGTAVSGADGAFTITYTVPTDPKAVLYLTATNPGSPPDPGAITLVNVLGTLPVASAVVINERTTVAAGFAMAQFANVSGIAGTSPGLQNAAGMTGNIANSGTGAVASVLASSPNGSDTKALDTFNSLANMIAACIETPVDCTALFAAAATPGGAVSANTFMAMVDIAKNPGRDLANVAALFAVSLLGSTPYTPARVVVPSVWALVLRFNGDGATMAGPGNFAIDHEGNLWVANNYQYNADPFVPVCGSDLLLKFTPTGQYVTGSPYRGGGLSGAGFGIDIDPYGDIWVGNFGFAAPAPGCPADQQPLHNSVSKFSPAGTALSPPSGFTAGGINFPQATVSDRAGNIWIANCAGSSVTLYPGGDPLQAKNLSGLGITEPFGIAHNNQGDAFVTGIGSSNVARLRPDGTPYPGSPITGPGTNFRRPMGIAADSGGNMWVANSGLIDLPCPTVDDLGTLGGSLSLLDPDGNLLSTTAFTGGGLVLPWGIATDGNDNVWVANFAGQRLSHFCGLRTETCPPGASTGDAISPATTGYSFGGLVRVTGVAVDQAGNVWLANNWKEIPVQTNPAGFQIVAYVGLAAPVDVPAPIARPTTPAAPVATPVVATPKFTG